MNPSFASLPLILADFCGQQFKPDPTRLENSIQILQLVGVLVMTWSFFGLGVKLLSGDAWPWKSPFFYLIFIGLVLMPAKWGLDYTFEVGYSVIRTANAMFAVYAVIGGCYILWNLVVNIYHGFLALKNYCCRHPKAEA